VKPYPEILLHENVFETSQDIRRFSFDFNSAVWIIDSRSENMCLQKVICLKR